VGFERERKSSLAKKKQKKKASKSEFQLVNWLRQKLRRISYQYPARKEAIRNARVERGRYKCAVCERVFKNGEFQLDHIHPVDDPHTGFTDWNNYIARLFVDVDGWQILCTNCHNTKSEFEQNIRRQTKKDKSGRAD
jgi:5-methylcytosine-specific restriction endonuclease McrA